MIKLESIQVYGQPERKGCYRCNDTGRIPVTEARMWVDVEGVFLNMPVGKERACAMWKIYRGWTIDGCVECPECRQ